MNRNTLSRLAASIAVLASGLTPLALAAQDPGIGTGGLVRLAQEQRALENPYRVLMIGAHPDDEDTELLTILSRGYGAGTAYLSLTRGEGGQNLVGNELGASLGVLRTGELLASRSVDGSRQFFTRAFDFGFSKSASESFQFWAKDSLVKDLVRVIRRFKPHIVISVWTGTELDGHGHHQASGIVAREAFDLAGEADRFVGLVDEEGLSPWTPAKFYRNRRVVGGLILDGGSIDPATGLSMHQIAMRARSQHRSQDMGQLEELGPSSTMVGLEAVADGVITTPLASIFDGLPTESARESDHVASVTAIQRGIVVDLFVDDSEVVPGQAVDLTAVIWNTGSDTVAAAVVPAFDSKWRADSVVGNCPGLVVVPPDSLVRCSFPLRIAEDAEPGQPYYLVNPPRDNLYQWSGDPAFWGDPFGGSLEAKIQLTWPEGQQLELVREAVARSVDQGVGEIRLPITVVPRLGLELSPAAMLWPSDLRSREFIVTAEHLGSGSVRAVVSLGVPDGWRVTAPQQVSFAQSGERKELSFEVTAPLELALGPVEFHAIAQVDGSTFDLGVRRISYEHVRPRTLFVPARAKVVVAPVSFPTDRSIGYLRGAADLIPEALAAAKVPFRLIGEDDLNGPILDSIDVLVIGPRAYETSPSVRRAHPRLLRFAREGGVLVTQYQQYQYVAGGFPPLPFTISRPHDRVTDEHAPIRLLENLWGLTSTPNEISTADFEDWVQERGLYFANEWDPNWTAILESHDADEAEKLGGLLVAPFGEGVVVYTGISFFRQLPASVPGAWRLFANLLALQRSE